MAPYDTPVASRRAFLAGAGGLVIAVTLPIKTRAQSGAAAVLGGEAAATTYAPNAFVRIGADNLVTVLIKHIEFGQGPFTGLATLVADELDADWSQIRAEHSPSDASIYGNAAFGGMQGTGGSTAMASSYMVMRQAGAAARAMLVSAAATAWGVPAPEITVSKGVIAHAASGRTGKFGEFAEAAAGLTPPAEPPLKSPDKFVYIGKETPKLDTVAKSTGEAIFTLDVYREGMLTAVVAHPRKFGASVASFDDAAARAVPGVVDVRKTSAGVAVYARNSYAALKGRKALKVTWSDGSAETRSSDAIAQERIDKAKRRGATAGESGAIDDAFASAATTLEAEYVFPYLAHAPMEPLDAVIERSADGGVEVWMGSQIQSGDHPAIAGVCGLEPAKVK
ncbi:MAG: molybdopterin-dependent oxidoreductase, partial [Amphiplicatus sp.]